MNRPVLELDAAPAVADTSPSLPAVQNGSALTPMEMLDRAVARGASVETLEKLMALQERYEKNQARKAFDEAMAAAKAEIPVILKNQTVGFESRKSGSDKVSYKHETLAQIAKTVDPILGKHGLSYRFRATSEVNAPVSVTCIVSHRAGHSEETTLHGGRDESGAKNSIQAIGSTITYLQRYTLKAALGLAAAADDDGKGAGTDDAGPITDEQADKIEKLVAATGTNIQKFLEYMKAPSISDIPASKYADAVAMLEKKQKKAGAAS